MTDPLPTKPPLAGANSDGKWKIGDSTGVENDQLGALAVFPLMKPKDGQAQVVGTAFFISTNGLFVTAKHVALEAPATDGPGSEMAMVQFMDNRNFLFRPISYFLLHPTADIALGIPYVITDNRVNAEYRGKVLKLDVSPQEMDAPVSTWGYPLYTIFDVEQGKKAIHFQPTFYDGKTQEYFSDRGPSGKLVPPYYLTNMHLHGAASGGPVFNTAGRVFGIASSSYDGAPDVSFVTPIGAIVDMTIPKALNSGDGTLRDVTVRELATLGALDIANMT